MRIYADLHIHGKHSQATSNDLEVPTLEKWARVKGISLLGTGDFTHPRWIDHLRSNLTEDGTGVLRTSSGYPFILQTEISLIYSQGGKGRRIHNIVLCPDLETSSQITDYLMTHGRVDYDGRPIFKIPCPEFVESLKEISPKVEVIPAHIWTPWFSLFGSNSGFDSVKECFEDQERHIHAMETGLSSDPPMNWRLSQLDRYTLISNSDLHSYWPWRMGRECNILDIKELTYGNVMKAINTREGFSGTIEVDPSYGKYHFDGHRACGVRLSPGESNRMNKICPVCKKQLTIGVLNRVEELADREEGYIPKDGQEFHSLIPLSDIIASVRGIKESSKKAWDIYNRLVREGRSEFDVLTSMPIDDISEASDEAIAKAVSAVRGGKLKVVPGYDGEYGVPVFDDRIPAPEPRKVAPQKTAQKGLDEFFKT